MQPPLPQPGESQPQYAVRFHAAMQQAIPLTDQRNKLMLSLWKEHGSKNALVEHQIRQRFGGQKYKKIENVAEFTEHRTRQKVPRKDKQGRVLKDEHGDVITEERPVVYDRDALEAVMHRSNERISDTGDFAPITDGHTPTEEGGKMPDVLGYVGPFYMGQVGNVNPRWAIFADEWHDTRESNRLEKLRRRSPELWMEERVEDRFLDPVAALGAETPRLDMGWSGYSRTADGRTVMKYSGPPADMPGEFSVSPAKPVKVKKHAASTEGSNMPPQQQQGDNGQLAAIANQVMQLIMESDVWQALKETVQSGPQSSFGDDEQPGEEHPPVDAAPAPAAPPAPEPATADAGDVPMPDEPEPAPEMGDVPGPGEGDDDDFGDEDDFDFGSMDFDGSDDTVPAPESEPEASDEPDDDFTADDFEDGPTDDAGEEPEAESDDDEPELSGGDGDDEITVDLDEDDQEMFARYMANQCSEEDLKKYRAKKSGKSAPKARYQGEEPLPMTEQYSRDPATGKQRYAKDLSEARQKARKAEKEAADLKARYSKQEQRIRVLERDKTNAERYSRLQELSRTFAVDADDEFQRCTVDVMPSQEAFEQHVGTIERYADNIPVEAGILPRGGDNGGSLSFQEAQEAKKKEAQAVVRYARQHGIDDYDVAKARYAKENAS